MDKLKQYLAIGAMVALISACKKPYYPPAITAPNSYLVVDGNISIGDTSVVRLSYTVNISGSAQSKPETNASITVEGSQSGSYPFTSRGNGSYVLYQINLPSNQNYRLKITTGDGRQYASDFVPVKNAPAIDTVSFNVTNTGAVNGLQINLNTHDANNATHYYRWSYIETYLIQSAYESHWMVVNHDTTALRTSAAQQIYHCWPSDTSGNLVLGSSARLANDVISQQPIVVIPSTSEKLRFRYSILVKQYALTTDAYNYYVLLQKNTEQLGSIFDAQPAELTGNIHSVSNPNEPVIGYITAGGLSQKRIFIDKSQLPAWTADTPYGSCSIDTILYLVVFPGPPAYYEHPVHDLIYSGAFTPIDAIGIGNIGFTASSPACVDCTLRGTNIQPSFWK